MSDAASNNLQELKAISQQAIIKEVTELTKNCALIWSQTSPNAYTVSKSVYDFYLNKTSDATVVLTLMRHGRFYRSYNSDLLSEVSTLFQVVDYMYAIADQAQILATLIQDIGQLEGCNPSS